jgi:dihydroorotase
VLIRGGILLDPSRDLQARLDLRLAGARIAEAGEHLRPEPGEEVIEADGAFVAPGFIDMHVHLREPGFEWKETIATGTEAAVRGGFTAVACMPNTRPALDAPEVLDDLRARCDREARCRVHPIAAVTKARAGAEPCDYAALRRAGAVAFSDDGDTVMDAALLRTAATALRGLGAPIISHALDAALHRGAAMHEGEVSRRLGLPGSPAAAEEVIVARDLVLAHATGARWHIAHLSTAGALELVRWARAHGVGITCEVTPHHLTFTDEAVERLGGAAVVNPPLRTADDARALREAVRRGEIDAFATDHAPHTREEKERDSREAAPGFTGLEIAVGAYASAVPDLPPLRFVALLSTNPASILGLEGGTLAPGAPADITIFRDEAWRVESARFASKGRVTPFDGMTLPRRAIVTIVGGKVAWRA